MREDGDAGRRTFRHSFVTHLFESGSDIATIQELLEQQDWQTMMIHTHILHRGRRVSAVRLTGCEPSRKGVRIRTRHKEPIGRNSLKWQ
ncbi:MAG: tyrosine-type recombinase/integrase [Nitrospira sp.]|nr:tyrosine-type recombinase/integrase [Nitrospira sp.]MCA9455474.1 tyrosine-type recombinase/integrase [Nitrospira sp.]